MGKFNKTERTIAKILENNPYIRSNLSNLYKRIIYLFYVRSGVRTELNKNINVKDVFENLDKGEHSMFFGYYDKSPWSPDGNNYLINSIKGKEDLTINIISSDFQTIEHKFTSRTWNYQQGCMAQWLNNDKLIYNDLVHKDKLGTILVDIKTGDKTLFQYPLQALNFTYNEFISLNYRRLARLRPEYGYFNNVKNFSPIQEFDKDGLWKVELETGKTELIITLEELMQLNFSESMRNAHHKVNHVMYAPDGKNFVFLHRWINKKGKHSRLIISDRTGNKKRILLDDRMISHYSWINDKELITWARKNPEGEKYFLIDVESSETKILNIEGVHGFGDGHPTFHRNQQLMITDTYPDKGRIISLNLINTSNQNMMSIGKFFSPWKFNGINRCDLHPRWHPFDFKVSIDSAHTGVRRNYIIDLSDYV